MSRHTIPHPTEPSLKLTYGFDRPLSYYFFQVTEAGDLIDSDELGGCTAAELLEVAKFWGFTLPPEHEGAAAMDLPIDDTPPPPDWKPAAIPGWVRPPAGRGGDVSDWDEEDWLWGADTAATRESMIDRITSHLVEYLNNGDLDLVRDPEDKVHQIRVTVDLVPRPDIVAGSPDGTLDAQD